MRCIYRFCTIPRARVQAVTIEIKIKKKSFKGYKFILIIKDLKFNSTEI